MPEKLDFITPTVTKVLVLFLRNASDTFHEREVMRRAKVSKGSASKILQMLAELKLLTRERRGRMIFYKPNMKDAAIRQLKILFNVWDLRDFTRALGEFSRRIVLFGSCAEGTDVEESDIDLFIQATEKKTVKKRISEFNVKSSRRIASIVVDANELVELKKEDKPLYERIEKGVTLWESE